MLVKKRVTSNYTSVETPYSIWEHRMPDEAIKHYREALKIRRELVELDPSFKPKLADALNNLANAYYTQGLLDQAIEHYNEALKIRREQVAILRENNSSPEPGIEGPARSPLMRSSPPRATPSTAARSNPRRPRRPPQAPRRRRGRRS